MTKFRAIDVLQKRSDFLQRKADESVEKSEAPNPFTKREIEALRLAVLALQNEAELEETFEGR